MDELTTKQLFEKFFDDFNGEFWSDITHDYMVDNQMMTWLSKWWDKALELSSFDTSMQTEERNG